MNEDRFGCLAGPRTVVHSSFLSFSGCFWRIVLGQVLRATGCALCRASTCMASTVMQHMPPAYCAGALSPFSLHFILFLLSVFSHPFLRLSRRFFFCFLFLFPFSFLLAFPFLFPFPFSLLFFFSFLLALPYFALLPSLPSFPSFSLPFLPSPFPSFLLLPLPSHFSFLPTACRALT